MAEIIKWRKNELGYPHILCGDCDSNLFHVATLDGDDNGSPMYSYVVCSRCGLSYEVNLKEVWAN